MPANEHQAFCWIKYSVPAAVEATAAKHFLRSPRGHFRKDRSPTGQSHTGCPRQVENVIRAARPNRPGRAPPRTRPLANRHLIAPKRPYQQRTRRDGGDPLCHSVTEEPRWRSGDFQPSPLVGRASHKPNFPPPAQGFCSDDRPTGRQARSPSRASSSSPAFGPPLPES
jgi:hypothetical protein